MEKTGGGQALEPAQAAAVLGRSIPSWACQDRFGVVVLGLFDV